MADKKEIKKQLVNARLLKSNGGWMYCNSCNSTVGYLCYSTYDYYYFSFVCNCGEHGSFELGEDKYPENPINPKEMIIKKGRLCCPHDQAPLFSIVEKNLKEYDYQVVCKDCSSRFQGKRGQGDAKLSE